MTTPGSPTVRRRRLAAELRAIRESTGKSGDVVANALKWSPSKISRYELARTGLKFQEVQKLLDYYQVSGPRREHLLELAKDAAQRGWWEEYADGLSADYQQFIGLEHEAASIAIWHVEVVAGLFQTEKYARHIISSYSQVEPIPPGLVERLVRVRIQRQQVLTREPAVQLSVVLDESILRRRVGSDEVMYEQLQRLAEDADRPNVTLRILPLDAQHTVFAESFVIFGFGPDENAIFQDVVSSEHLKSAFSLEGERETYLHRLVFQMIVRAALDPDSSRELIREAAESYWSNAQRVAKLSLKRRLFSSSRSFGPCRAADLPALRLGVRGSLSTSRRTAPPPHSPRRRSRRPTAAWARRWYFGPSHAVRATGLKPWQSLDRAPRP